MKTIIAKVGDQSNQVGELNQILYGLGYNVNNSYLYDNQTRNSVASFQSAAGLPVTGVLDDETYNLLNEVYSIKYGSGAAAAPTEETFTERAVGSAGTLQEGMRGSDVKALQERLNVLGYNAGTADGIFGPQTTLAVKRFQAANGLTADGIVGPKTRDALYAPSISPAEITRPTLRQGDTGSFVLELQNALINFGFLTGSADGKFGAATYNAVTAFQRAAGLLADGVVGQGTWKALDNYGASSGGSGGGTGGGSTARPTLRQGDSGEYVRQLQTFLINNGFLTGSADGKFGPATYNAVVAFQRAVGITADGVVGQGTWSAIDNYSGGGSSGGSGGGVRPTIRQGDTGVYVRQLQQRLTELGFYNGAIDGNFGPGTTTAVKLFQSAAGLTADGVVGARTWTALDEYSGGGPGSSLDYPTIRQGDTGSYVQIMQQRLKELGYFTGTVDGIFGPNTTTIVKRFQTDNGLTADGVVGRTTWNKLLNSSELPQNYPSVKRGDSGRYVNILQTQLKYLGYYFGSITGNFDEATEEALINFQTARGLPGDGVAGTATWKELFPDYSNLPSVGNRPVLRKGDIGEAVKTLQQELKKLMYYNGTISGTFDEATLSAVKAFQASNGLGADGVVGEKTWAALQQLYPPVVSC